MDTLPEKFTHSEKFAFNLNEFKDPLDTLAVHVAQIKNFCCKIVSDMEIHSSTVIKYKALVYKDRMVKMSSFLWCVLREINICRIPTLTLLLHCSFNQVSFYVTFYGSLHMSAHFFAYLII